MIRVRHALFSVYEKDGLLPLAREVARWGAKIISSGGTAAHLRAAGLDVASVEDLTGLASLFGGRVKTLHPRIHGGILFRRDREEDVREAEREGIAPIDLVVVNLYPFRQGLERGLSAEELIELIDIGGPALVRAAAKNHRHVGVVTLPEDYALAADALARHQGCLPESLCEGLAARAFAVTSAYDGAIASYLSSHLSSDFGKDGGASGAGAHASADSVEPAGTSAKANAAAVAGADADAGAGAAAGIAPEASSHLPEVWEVRVPRRRLLRYGENPSQEGALYGTGDGFPFNLEQLHGKELSYNNLLDLACARDLLAEFDGGDASHGRPARALAVVIKHGIPCGVARGRSLTEAYRQARDADALSAFGGVVGFSATVDVPTAELLNETFLEVVLAEDFEAEALEILARKKNRVLLRAPRGSLSAGEAGAALGLPWFPRGRFAGQGVLLQTPMPRGLGESEWKVVTRRAPDPREAEDLLFGWKVLKHVRSNGVLFARDGQTLGVGSGQCSRIDSVEIALHKAGRCGHELRGSVMVSDAFFPFRDCVDRAAGVGVTAVLHPGGSIRDEESVVACDEHGMAMVLNAARVFSHG